LWLRAERQVSGRGRQGRVWISPPGNLYASTLVRLQPEDPPAPTLALLAAVALNETLARLVEGVSIKWPNDLVVNGAKLAGILLERQHNAVILGFGVNLADHPDLPDRAVTSVKVLAGSAPGPDAFAETLAEIFARWLIRWRAEGHAPILDAWRGAAHPKGTPLTTPEGDGLFDGLDESGGLRLLMDDGAVRIIHAGDVFLL
jgi:BirA family biotin operon repressor/biotin-[acetyl-CoA-carboxylase] ligase